VGGQQYTFSGYLNRVSNGGTSSSYLQINWLDSSGTFISATTSAGAGSLPPTVHASGAATTGIFRDFFTVAAPSTAAYALVQVVQNGGASGGTADTYVDGVLFNAGSLPSSYFDGDFPGYAWSGTPGNSTSVGLVLPTWAAIRSQMPAWIVPTFSVVTGGDYATLAASHSSYTLMEAAHTHYSDIPTNPAA
jgi:hypothetical protein